MAVQLDSLNASQTKRPIRSKGVLSRPVPIHIRARRPQKDLIDTAAAILGKNRSDFMLEAACREAEAVILDQRVIHLGSKEYQAFLAQLDAPPQVRTGLKNLFRVRVPWEQ